MLEGKGWIVLPKEESWKCSNHGPKLEFFSFKMFSIIGFQVYPRITTKLRNAAVNTFFTRTIFILARTRSHPGQHVIIRLQRAQNFFSGELPLSIIQT